MKPAAPPADRLRLARLLAESKKRRRDPVAELLAATFPQQRAFIDDPSRLKAACCTRRAGKTYGVGVYICLEALRNPGCNILYLALTRQNAKDIVLKDVFQDLDRRFGLGIGDGINYGELKITFPNGSVVHINGADTAERQHSKFTGKKYRLVVIDEGQFWKTNLFNLVEKALWPAMSDVNGTICLIGVPDSAHAFFHDVVTQKVDTKSGRPLHPGWSVHAWTAFDNPHMAAAWQRDIDGYVATNPLFLQTPTYRQQWLGEWVDDPDARCYRYDDSRNRIATLPGNVADYTWLLGLDVGYSPDPMAFVVCGYRTDNTDNTLYFVHASKQAEMSIDATGARINELRARWPVSTFVMDGANGNVVAELTKRLQIPFEKAEKVRKVDFINMMSDDLIVERVKLAGTGADALADEWLKLVWDRRNPARPTEHSSCENHCCDAALYAWRRAFHYVKALAKAPVVLSRDTDAWARQRQQLLMDRYSRARSALQELDDAFFPGDEGR